MTSKGGKGRVRRGSHSSMFAVWICVALTAACGGEVSGAGRADAGGSRGGASGDAASFGGAASGGRMSEGELDGAGAALGNASGGDGASSGSSVGLPPHDELCQLSATCNNGQIYGQFSYFCVRFQVSCELGCREARYSSEWPGGYDDSLAVLLAKDALCNDGSGGAGGDSAGEGATAQAGAAGAFP